MQPHSYDNFYDGTSPSSHLVITDTLFWPFAYQNNLLPSRLMTMPPPTPPVITVVVLWPVSVEINWVPSSQDFRLSFHRPFPRSLVPLFQNESKYETFHMKMSSAYSFISMQIKVMFIRMLRTLSRFETEAQGNSEMNYSLINKNYLCTVCSRSKCIFFIILFLTCVFILLLNVN